MCGVLLGLRLYGFVVGLTQTLKPSRSKGSGLLGSAEATVLAAICCQTSQRLAKCQTRIVGVKVQEDSYDAS